MFDISWSEFLLIGVIALIVIGPKELPGVLRTLGQYTRKVRSMAAEFQNQFQEAMREAEMADLKKQVDDMAHDLKDIDPLKGVREDVEAAGKDIERSLSLPPDEKPALPAAEGVPADTNASASVAAADAALATSAPATSVAAVERSELEAVNADTTAKSTETAAETASPDGTGRPA